MNKEQEVEYKDNFKLKYEVKPIIIRVDKDHKWKRAREKEKLRNKIEEERL